MESLCFTWATPPTFCGYFLGGLTKGTLGFEWAIGSLRVHRYGHGGFTVQNLRLWTQGLRDLGGLGRD